MVPSPDQVIAVGRRKAAVARVRMQSGSGKIVVNKKDIETFCPDETTRGFLMQPMMITGTTGAFDIQITVAGGGSIGQAGAIRHGIARALEKANGDYRAVLKESGMLTRDSRVKERKKPGRPGARKRFQFSKR